MATDKRSLLEIAQAYAAPGLPVRMTLLGIKPGFLMHNAAALELGQEAAEEARRGGNRGKFIPSAEQEASWGVYTDDDENLILAAHVFLRALQEAAKAFKMPKSRASMKTAVTAGVTAPPNIEWGWPLLDPKTGKQIKKYDIDRRRVVVHGAGVMRARPLVKDWKVDLELLIDTESISPTVFAEIVGYAGTRQGVGDFRPEKGGQFGRYAVTALDVL